jgi:hypothetical protein
MHRVSRLLCLSLLVLAAAAKGQDAPAPSPATTEQRVERLEKLLAETRSELAAMKAASASADADAKLAEIERKIDILGREIAMKIGEAAGTPSTAATAGPEPLGPQQTDSRYGLGLAASKVYGIPKGVSIGGYGEALYENFADTRQDGSPSNRNDRIDFLRAVAYLGYKFSDHWV